MMELGLAKRDGGNRCASKHDFTNPAIITELAVWGLMLSLSIVAGFFWLRWQSRKPGVRELLPWYTYALALCLSMLFYILYIPAIPLEVCIGLDETPLDWGLLIAGSIAADFANMILLAIIFIPLTTRILTVTGRSTQFLKVLHVSLLTFAVLLFIPYISLSTLATVRSFVQLKLSTTTRAADVAVEVSYRAVLFLVSLVNAVVLLFATTKPALTANHAILPSKLKFYAALTPVLFAISNLPPILYYPLFGVSGPKAYTNVPFIINIVLSNLCLTLTFVSLLMAANIASSYALPDLTLDFNPYTSSRFSSSGEPKRTSTMETNRSRYSFTSAVASPSCEPVPDVPNVPPIDLTQAAPPAFRPDRRKSVRSSHGGFEGEQFSPVETRTMSFPDRRTSVRSMHAGYAGEHTAYPNRRTSVRSTHAVYGSEQTAFPDRRTSVRSSYAGYAVDSASNPDRRMSVRSSHAGYAAEHSSNPNRRQSVRSSRTGYTVDHASHPNRKTSVRSVQAGYGAQPRSPAEVINMSFMDRPDRRKSKRNSYAAQTREPRTPVDAVAPSTFGSVERKKSVRSIRTAYSYEPGSPIEETAVPLPERPISAYRAYS